MQLSIMCFILSFIWYNHQPSASISFAIIQLDRTEVKKYSQTKTIVVKSVQKNGCKITIISYHLSFSTYEIVLTIEWHF